MTQIAKVACVRFDKTGVVYHYFTNIDCIPVGTKVLCDSSNKLGIGKFIMYTTFTGQARAWILQVIDAKELRNNLRHECEESNLSTRYIK